MQVKIGYFNDPEKPVPACKEEQRLHTWQTELRRAGTESRNCAATARQAAEHARRKDAKAKANAVNRLIRLASSLMLCADQLQQIHG